MAKQELLAAIRDRYHETGTTRPVPRDRYHETGAEASSRKDQSRILDEFSAVSGYHRQHGIRLLAQSGAAEEQLPGVRSRRIYAEAVREAVILVWEAADRICGKRLKASLLHLVESMERHGQLDPDPQMRRRLLSASAATLDRRLKPVRAIVLSRRKGRRNLNPGRHIPGRPFADWDRPPPGSLEIDLVAHCGTNMGGSFTYSLWPPTSAPGGPRRCLCWLGSSPWWWQGWRQSPNSCPFPFSASTRTTSACSSTTPSPSTAPTGASSSLVPERIAKTLKPGLSRRMGR